MNRAALADCARRLADDRPAEAEAALRDFLDRSPGDPEARRLLGEALWGQGQADAALAEYHRLLQERPDHPAAHYNWATLCKRAARFDDAEAGFRRTIELFPTHLDAHFNLGNLLLELDRPGEAEAAFRRALVLRPDHLPALSNLGLALQQQGRNEAAHEAFQSALALDPTDPVAGCNLEQLRGRLLPPWHLPMLADTARNEAYDHALRRAVRADTRVLDIGAGSGLLAMMAARAGAREVYACEMRAPVAAAAADVLRANGMETRVRLLPRKSTQLRPGVDLPGRADLLVSEIVDVGLLGEGVIPTVRHAWANLLTEDARIIPAAARVYVALAALPRLGRVYPPRHISGFDLSPFARFASPREYRAVHLGCEPHSLLSEPVLAWTVDFHDLPAPHPANAPRQWEFFVEAAAAGEVNALVFWFELDLDAAIAISTAPGSDIFCWGQAVQFQPQPRAVRVGEAVAVRGEQSDERLGFFLV